MLKLFCLALILLSAECIEINHAETRPDSANGPKKHWGYRNEDKSLLPPDWHKHHAKCYGQMQSPINVESKTTVFNRSLTEINVQRVQSGDLSDEKWSIKNNGFSVVLTPLNHRFGFTMSPANGEYRLLQMHFHWRGSEHYIDGHKFAAELHLVHQNVANSNKFAVLGFLFSITNKDNENLEPIIESLKGVLQFNRQSEIDSLKLDNLVPFNIRDYYRYSGSLTTPECDEVVEWFVIDNPVFEISEEQMLDFQSVEDQNGYPILTNVRPVQNVNDRTVMRSFESLKKLANPRRHFKSASGHTENFAVKSCVVSFSFALVVNLVASWMK